MSIWKHAATISQSIDDYIANLEQDELDELKKDLRKAAVSSGVLLIVSKAFDHGLYDRPAGSWWRRYLTVLGVASTLGLVKVAKAESRRHG